MRRLRRSVEGKALVSAAGSAVAPVNYYHPKQSKMYDIKEQLANGAPDGLGPIEESSEDEEEPDGGGGGD